ncbi:hypothetical protein VT84_31210 [Gemmata sp. SH-PL17]|uniref:hypothetical protein n=1 Tax=Gemmata sp. SH-PL17 TaxID=1630693 RepID=UPI00078EAFC9|nr:hypothetical protein [Gemmata sp. SH-PL17]AMV28904.1 hypothetical protein VT84_31210 [Gemmata sp. SH-PL17]
MPTLTIEYSTEAERLQYERAIAYVQELNRLGTTATPGTVLDTCELFALERGRELLRDNLADTLQARIDAAPKKCPATGAKGTSGVS